MNQNEPKTLLQELKKIYNFAKMEQTKSRMKIYFQLCRGAAHFRTYKILIFLQ